MFSKTAMKNKSIKSYIKTGFLFYITTVIAISMVLYSYIDARLAAVLDVDSWSYFLTAVLSQSAIFALIPFIVALPFLLFKCSRVLYAPVFITFSSFVILFLCINKFVYALYRFHINEFVIDMLLSDAAGDIFQFDIYMYIKVALIALSFVVGMALLWFLCKKIYNKWQYAAVVPVVAILLLATLFSHLYHAYADAVGKADVIRCVAVVPYNFPLTARRMMFKLGVLSAEDNHKKLKVDAKSGIKYPINPIVSSSDSVKKNIIFIVVDSWNYRACRPDVTPNISEFAKKSSIFNNHISSSHATNGGIMGLFFSLPALFRELLDAANVQPLLIEQMIAKGYNIKPFSSASMVHPPFARLLFAKVPDLRIGSSGETVYERDCEITRDFINFLDEDNNEPFFAFLFYDLPHSFELPAEKNKRFTPAWDYADYMALNNEIDPTPFWNLYRNTVYQTDSLIGCVLDKLKERELMKNSIIVITGDHGQEFNEYKNNYWGHNSNFSPMQIRVPMMLFDADKPVQTYNHYTTHYDIPQTILKDYLGVQNPVEDLGVGSLLTDTRSRFWHIVGDDSNYAFIMDDELRIFENSHSGLMSIYDSVMNPLDGYKFDAVKLNTKLMEINRFYE